MAHPATTPTSFEREALPHLDTLYRVALRLTGDDAPAQDLVQDTMLRALRGWGGFRPGSNARAWLVTILRNTFINEYRRRRREPAMVELDDAAPHAIYDAVADADPEGSFFARIVDERVLAAVDALPAEFREVLVLSDMEGMSYAEIAAALAIPLGTLKSRLFRGRRLLQRQLYDHALAMGYISPREVR
ncbi:MAG TPA: sigma-70 family RNA polymerase sigma factor [Gemmatimonadales bacterium]|nr:sigma-70 family RNA polymerase sigma factor [Gemmatimonadales bacterium]